MKQKKNRWKTKVKVKLIMKTVRKTEVAQLWSSFKVKSSIASNSFFIQNKEGVIKEISN